MSRSLIDRVRASLTPQTRIGLAIGRDYVGMARLGAVNGTWQVIELTQAALESKMFTRSPSVQATNSLSNTIGALVGNWRRGYVPIHVSVPDAVMRFATFELDQLPKTPAEQKTFVGFRFATDGDDGLSVCASQDLGRDGDKYLLLGAALVSDWQRCIVDALDKAGVVAWSLSANSLRLFNRHYRSLADSSGALVLGAPDSWALLIWDAQRRVRFVRARWRTSSADHADTAADVERSIIGYVHAHADNAITRIYVCAGQETTALAAELDARLREPCTQLSENAGLTFIDSINQQVASAPLSLAAALEQ